MSLLWSDQIDVFFAPERVDLVRTKSGLKSRLKTKLNSGLKSALKPVQLPTVTQFVQNNAKAQPLWLSPMQQLESLLSQATGTEMTVTLSNHFVRYVSLPAQEAITSPEEVWSYADFRMREIYGTRVDHWEVSVSDWSPLYGAVCAAIPQEFLVQLQEIATRHQVKFKGIEPYLTAVLDRWVKSLNKQRAFVALIETGRVCVAVLENGAWRSIRNQRMLNGVTDELLAMLDQEAVMSGAKAAIDPVFLFAPEHPGLVLPTDSGWEMVELQTGLVPPPSHYPVAATEKSGESICHA